MQRRMNQGLDNQRGMNRGLDNQRGMNRGLDNQRGMNRGLDNQRGMNRGLDNQRGMNRGLDNQRGMNRGLDNQRGMNRGLDNQKASAKGDFHKRQRTYKREHQSMTWLCTEVDDRDSQGVEGEHLHNYLPLTVTVIEATHNYCCRSRMWRGPFLHPLEALHLPLLPQSLFYQ